MRDFDNCFNQHVFKNILPAEVTQLLVSSLPHLVEGDLDHR